jgi:hypothetical protein
MADVGSKLGWNLLRGAIGIPASIAARKGVRKAWTTFRPDDPPRDLTDPNLGWRDAIVWVTLGALGVAVAELMTTKGASTVWRNLVGSEPPPVGAADRVTDAAVARA